MSEMPAEVQAQIQQFQALSQQLQAVAQQRAQMELMKAEGDEAVTALEELDATAPVYRNVGAILVKEKDRDTALARLKDEAETLGLRLERMRKQETQVQEQLRALQKKLQSALGAQ